MVIIGYSGHALVASGILDLIGKPVTGYCDKSEKSSNPLNIPYLGSEDNPGIAQMINSGDFFISIGDNHIREKVARRFKEENKFPLSLIHPSAIISSSARISPIGVMVSSGACINPLVQVMEGAIVNTSSIIEHECVVGAFAHIGPGAILCGNVSVGNGSFIGAGAVVRQNIQIGRNVIVGAGSVVIADIEDNECVAGNPAKKIVVNKTK